MITVTITELGKDRQWQSSHNTEDTAEAIGLAIRESFGPDAFFQKDPGLPVGEYGQIFRRTGSDGFQATSLTGRVRIDETVQNAS